MVTARTTRLCIASSLPREPCSKPPAPVWRRQAPRLPLCTDPEVRARGSGAQLPRGHGREKGLKQISYVKAKAGTGATRQLQGLQIAQECSNATPGTQACIHTDTLKPYMCTREPSHTHARTHVHARSCTRHGMVSPRHRDVPHTHSPSQPGRASWLPPPPWAQLPCVLPERAALPGSELLPCHLVREADKRGQVANLA